MTEIQSILDKTPSEIFTTHTLTQIQQISDELTQLSKAKHNELRSLVSSKYRDLLKTGDDILDIRDLGIKQDKELYDLSFFRSEKLNRISTIERSFRVLHETNYEHSVKGHEVLDQEAQNTELVLLNSDFWISFSSLLEINSSLSLDTTLNKLIEFSKFIKISKFNKLLALNERVTKDKFQDINHIILDKLLNDTYASSQLSQIYLQIHQNKLTELKHLNVTQIDLEIFNNLIRIIDTFKEQKSILSQYVHKDESSDKIFTDFPEFNNKFQAHISSKLASLQADLTKLVETYQPEHFLDLYDLEFQNTSKVFSNDEYLLNIYYLSNGIDNSELIAIIEKLNTFKALLLKLLRFFLDSEDGETYSEHFVKFIKDLKDKCGEDNVALVKYLDTLKSIDRTD